MVRQFWILDLNLWIDPTDGFKGLGILDLNLWIDSTDGFFGLYHQGIIGQVYDFLVIQSSYLWKLWKT
ncbi:hypothetical protein [Brasilonema bromeliae]|uniref:Uncharacterized protein n=1 Tax=Brasilonema bromeliae SPC951 TaxID=385972 RepID=A0ABX1PB72_9CYAN|nr:hypothetical protein [Brasilonema bromeliae]NMG21719.1 hypothetical protein [Brasilonema bromeliae SPC951]